MAKLAWKTATLAIALFPVAAMAAPNVTKQCLDHTHQGFAVQQKGMTRSTTAMAALQDWTKVVTAHDGASWAKISRGTPVNCVQVPANSPNKHWQCTVVYRPCRMVPTNYPSSVPTPGLHLNPGN